MIHFNPQTFVLGIIGLTLALIGFGIGAWILRREILSRRFRLSLFGLRLVSLLLLCLLLLPLLVKFRYSSSSRPSVLVLVDATQSMSLGASDGSKPRIERTREELHSALPSLRRRFQVEIARFGGTSLQPISDVQTEIQPSADATDLAAAFRDAQRWFAGRPLDAVLLVSDGRITAGGSPKLAAAALGVPVFTAGFEESAAAQSVHDLAIIGVNAPRVSLAANTVRVEITLRATGLEPAKHAVEILEGGHAVAQGEVVFQKDQREARTDMAFIPQKPGYHVYTVRAAAVPKEEVTRNNELAFALNVENALRRVCMVESQWRQEYRYTKRALEEDPNLKFAGFLRVKETQFKQQVEPTEVAAPLPSSLREFEFYDAVILGDINPLTLPPKFTRLLSDYVAELGGGLIVTGGAEVFGPTAARDPDLMALLPVTLGSDTTYFDSKYQVLLTPEGAQHPIFDAGGVDWKKNRMFWRSLPELSSICLFTRAKPGAEVLAVHPQLANEFGQRIVIAAQQFGKGRVLVLGTDHTWNWAFQESRPGFDQLHEQFWRQAVRFVARRPKENASGDALRPEKETVYEGETVRLRLAVPPELASKTGIKVTGETLGPDEKKETITFTASDPSNTVWETKFKATRTGPYRTTATVSADGVAPANFETAVCVSGGAPEFENTAVNNALLRDLAESTGGKFGYVGELSKLSKSIKPARHAEERLFEWDSASSKMLAGLILALWAGEWMLRKLKNLA